MLKSSFIDFFIECFTFVVVFVQSPSHIRPSHIFATPQTAARQDSLSFTVSWSLLKLMSIELSNHLILCCPLLLLPSKYPSIRVFSNEYSGLISFRTDCFDLPSVQGILKSLLQHHSLKASILWHSAFFLVQLSYS